MLFEIQIDGELKNAAEGNPAIMSCLKLQLCTSNPGNIWMPPVTVEMNCGKHESISTSLALPSPKWSLWSSTNENSTHVLTSRRLAAALSVMQTVWRHCRN